MLRAELVPLISFVSESSQGRPSTLTAFLHYCKRGTASEWSDLHPKIYNSSKLKSRLPRSCSDQLKWFFEMLNEGLDPCSKWQVQWMKTGVILIESIVRWYCTRPHCCSPKKKKKMVHFHWARNYREPQLEFNNLPSLKDVLQVPEVPPTLWSVGTLLLKVNKLVVGFWCLSLNLWDFGT